MFETELTYNNQKGFICSIYDFEQIEEIANSRYKIRNQIKHEKYNEAMMTYVQRILNNRTEHEVIFATKDVTTGKMLCYTIVLFPPGSDFYFAMTAEARHSETLLNYDDSGIALMHRLVGIVSHKKKLFNGFTCMKLSSVIPAIKISLTSKVHERRLDFRIHSVIHPNQENLSRVERVFMEAGYGLYDRSKDSFGILHMSALPNFRTEHL